jgi:hypothetical protein
VHGNLRKRKYLKCGKINWFFRLWAKALLGKPKTAIAILPKLKKLGMWGLAISEILNTN